MIAVMAFLLSIGEEKYDHFHEKVLPLLQARCVSCHGADKQKGGLRLDSLAALLKGGENGPSIAPGKPDESLLIRAVRHSHPDVKMPPKEKLSDDQVAALARWVKEGPVWPADAAVLFEDDEGVAEALHEGQGSAKVVDDRKIGRSALRIERQKMAARVEGWSFKVAEKPGPGEVRFIRFAWKKRGGGGIYVELANDGQWRAEEKLTNAAWTAGKNTSGWKSHSVAEEPPADWTVVTRDLWADRGTWDAFTVTGICITALDGGEALIDGVVLGPTLESLDAYRPGRGRSAAPPKTAKRLGDAWTDPENPIRKIFAGKRLDLWSLRKVERPSGTIDSLVRARLEKERLSLSPEADRRTLIRRVTFDLTGLPPTPEEVDAFVAEGDYGKLVDRLLASPRYGERWARHWLDVVRYAETQGFERDEFRPLTYRYRDYVVRALNEDKPFDRFIREQLAGDELVDGPPKDAADVDRLIATGFLRLGPWDSTGSIFEENAKNRNELMADLANTTGSAFLGLTMSCANCHDHKFDPISQADHFRLRAFFAAVKPEDQVIDLGPEQERIRAHNAAIDAELEATKRSIAGILEPARRKVEDGRREKLADDVKDLLAIDEKKRTKEQKEKLKPVLEKLKVNDKDAAATLDDAAKKALEALRKEEGGIASRKRSFTLALSMKENPGKVPSTRVFYQGDFTEPRDEVPAGFISVLDPNPAEIARPADGLSTGRRTALADWIASPANPLTARVIANRLWHHHFGRGIVGTPNDFGFSGQRPTHPDLLDWLASELVREGWSLKKLHRAILLSATYRQSSRHDPAKAAVDPENKLLWRQNPRRLEAEGIRDAMLAVSGKLLPKDSGPSVWPPVPQDLLTAQPGILETKDDKAAQERRQGWYADPLEKTDVRSIFLIHKRVLTVPFLEPFDLPESTASCGRRDCTVVAPQALSLLNSDFTERASLAFAERVRKEAPDRPVERVVRLALGRSPSPAELKIGERVLAEHAKIHAKKADPAQAALVDFCRAILNVNEFIYLD